MNSRNQIAVDFVELVSLGAAESDRCVFVLLRILGTLFLIFLHLAAASTVDLYFRYPNFRMPAGPLAFLRARISGGGCSSCPSCAQKSISTSSFMLVSSSNIVELSLLSRLVGVAKSTEDGGRVADNGVAGVETCTLHCSPFSIMFDIKSRA